ncbi:MAG: rRNA maturation RNase YbeY [Treponema sp.]|nr:rRNA maturation RNase YbeY [Treponema sp.]
MANRFLVDSDGIDQPQWIGRVEPFMQKLSKALSFDGQEVSILFCGDETIKELNKNYRNIDAATDVLSFENGEKFTDQDGVEWLLAGDIAISVDTLKKNAEYFECDQNSELKRLLLHGLLHLNGFDHGEEHIQKGVEPECEMLKLQEDTLLKFEGEKII